MSNVSNNFATVTKMPFFDFDYDGYETLACVPHHPLNHIDNYCQRDYLTVEYWDNIKFFSSCVIAKNYVNFGFDGFEFEHGDEDTYIRKSAKYIQKIEELLDSVSSSAEKCNPQVYQFNEYIAEVVKKKFIDASELIKNGLDFAFEIYEIFYLTIYYDIGIYEAFALNLPYDVKTIIATKLCEDILKEIFQYYQFMSSNYEFAPCFNLSFNGKSLLHFDPLDMAEESTAISDFMNEVLAL